MQTPIAAADYERFCRFLEQACGITLGTNKEYLLHSRLGNLLNQSYAGSMTSLLRDLESGRVPTVREQVIDAMTTNETLWFRDGSPFEILGRVLLPELAKGRKQPVRIWSAACSSGQEPYSISMIVAEFQAAHPGVLNAEVEILATDISPSVLAQAVAGRYDQIAIGRGLSLERQRRYFSADGPYLRIQPAIAKRITFKEVNLLKPFGALGQFDIIFCRNVLIYFSTANKQLILSKLARQLGPRGYLFLGGSEPIVNYSSDFETLRALQGVYYRLK